jgi:YD repeat-containing protein
MVTTYTYKPLVGIATSTDPRGRITTYTYDNFVRLVKVVDADGNIVSENVYKYRNQN